jgi:hypothetical protein
MLAWHKRALLAISCGVLLFLTSCGVQGTSWRKDKLVAQMQRQYKAEVVLAYNDLQTKDRVEEQQEGYGRAHFDNDRKQIIFTKDTVLEYLIDGQEKSTATADISGYPADILTNETYQLAIEILDVQADHLGQAPFDGAKSRIIDLNTGSNVIVDGLLFNRSLLVGHYFYGFTFDNEQNQLFDIIDLRTMQHERIKRATDKITFIYEMAGEVYVQVASQKTAYRLDGFDLVQTQASYDGTLPNFEHGAQVLKDIAPEASKEHWYVDVPDARVGALDEVALLRALPTGEVTQQPIRLPADGLVQIIDVTRYKENQIALFYMRRDQAGDLHTIISVFDLAGNEQHSAEMTDLLHEDVGRFTQLDYVE